MEDRGQLLTGGRMTHNIVRDGPRVYRPLGSWSAAVREYLRHLESVGFVGAPRVVGVEDGREILTFIDGDVPVDPQWQPGHGNRLPPYARTEQALIGAAKLVKRLHRAAAGFEPTVTEYRFHPFAPRAGQLPAYAEAVEIWGRPNDSYFPQPRSEMTAAAELTFQP
jgi:hypothetical protein